MHILEIFTNLLLRRASHQHVLPSYSLLRGLIMAEYFLIQVIWYSSSSFVVNKFGPNEGRSASKSRRAMWWIYVYICPKVNNIGVDMIWLAKVSATLGSLSQSLEMFALGDPNACLWPNGVVVQWDYLRAGDFSLNSYAVLTRLHILGAQSIPSS